MSTSFFSTTHSIECNNLNDNSFTEVCICENCLCHICLFNNSKIYRRNYIEFYFKKHVEILKNG